MTNIFDNMPPVITPSRTVVSTPAPATTVESAIPQAATSAATAVDTVEISANKKERKGPIKAIKGFIANIKKFFANTGEYIKGTAKGLGFGAITASVVYTVGQLAKHFAKEGSKLAKVKNVPLAIASGAAVLAANLWTASLNATERSSEIDHRWTGHNK